MYADRDIFCFNIMYLNVRMKRSFVLFFNIFYFDVLYFAPADLR